MKKVTIVRPDGSKLILEGATPEEILKLSPAPAYVPVPYYPWPGINTWPYRPWVVYGNVNGAAANPGVATFTLTSNAGSSV